MGYERVIKGRSEMKSVMETEEVERKKKNTFFFKLYFFPVQPARPCQRGYSCSKSLNIKKRSKRRSQKGALEKSNIEKY